MPRPTRNTRPGGRVSRRGLAQCPLDPWPDTVRSWLQFKVPVTCSVVVLLGGKVQLLHRYVRSLPRVAWHHPPVVLPGPWARARLADGADGAVSAIYAARTMVSRASPDSRAGKPRFLAEKAWLQYAGQKARFKLIAEYWGHGLLDSIAAVKASTHSWGQKVYTASGPNLRSGFKQVVHFGISSDGAGRRENGGWSARSENPCEHCTACGTHMKGQPLRFICKPRIIRDVIKYVDPCGRVADDCRRVWSTDRQSPWYAFTILAHR